MLFSLALAACPAPPPKAEVVTPLAGLTLTSYYDNADLGAVTSLAQLQDGHVLVVGSNGLVVELGAYSGLARQLQIGARDWTFRDLDENGGVDAIVGDGLPAMVLDLNGNKLDTPPPEPLVDVSTIDVQFHDGGPTHRVKASTTFNTCLICDYTAAPSILVFDGTTTVYQQVLEGPIGKQPVLVSPDVEDNEGRRVLLGGNGRVWQMRLK